MSRWVRTTISEVADLYDGPHATPTKTKIGPWFLSISSLKDGRLDLSESAHLSEEDYIAWTRRVTPRGGDVLFSYETRLGSAALMPDGLRACLGRRMALLRAKPGVVDSRFLLYAFLGPSFQQEIRKRTVHGATVDRILLADMPTWPIDLPPSLAEQRAIAEALGALDDKIAANEAVATHSKLLGDAFLTAWLESDRCNSRMDELQRNGFLTYSDGYRTKQSELGTPGIGILRVADIGDGIIKPAVTDFVRHEYRAAIGPKTARPHDVVVTTKGTVGRVAAIPADAPELVYSPQVCYFRVAPVSTLTPAYLWHWFQSDRFRSQAARLKGQTDMADYINLGDIGSLRVEVPDDSDAPFLQRLDSMMSLVLQMHRESRTLARIRDTLLPRLMSGEVRVREAEKVVEEVL